MRTYEKKSHTAALTADDEATAISATVSNGHSSLVWVTKVRQYALGEDTELAEVLHTQPATATLMRPQQLHVLSCPY
jgi:hypothetical protein